MRVKEQSTMQSEPSKTCSKITVVVEIAIGREYHECLTMKEAERLLKKYPESAYILGSKEEIPPEHFPK